MADTYLNVTGKLLKLIDQGDGTFAIATDVVQLSGSNVEETNGDNIATKSNLVAGKSPTGKQRPLNVDEDGKLQVGGITVESLTATTVGIDQTTPGTTNKVVAELSGSNVEGTLGAAAPTKANLAGGKYNSVDPSYDDGDIGALRINSKGELAVNLASGLDSSLDTVNVNKMGKGDVTTAHAAITATATSAEIDCRGYNSLLVECAVSDITSGNWVVEVQGSAASGGTLGLYTNLADAAPAGIVNLYKSASMNADGNYILIFKGILDYNKIVATRTTDGTLTCKVQPFNL